MDLLVSVNNEMHSSILKNSESSYPEDVGDGKSQTGKEMPMDSYHYVIDLKYYDVEPLVGTINVIK